MDRSVYQLVPRRVRGDTREKRGGNRTGETSGAIIVRGYI